MDFFIQNIEFIKNTFYIIGSLLGIITFINSVRKRDTCMFTYRTEMGNESHPMLICIRGDMYNVCFFNEGISYYAHKLPASFKFSSVRENEYNQSDLDQSAFFAHLKEGEALLVDNEDLSLNMKIEFEDQYRNKYFQTFELLNKEIGNPERFKKNRSQSLYFLSKRKRRFMWIWL